MNYVKSSVLINSKWFDLKGRDKRSVYKDHIKEDGLFLYVSLYKFIVIRQTEDVLFTSVAVLSEETRISCKCVSEYLLEFERNKIIKIQNRTRRNSLLDTDGSLLVDVLLKITFTDVPDRKKNVEDRYVVVNFKLCKWMFENGLGRRHLALYCLFYRFSSGGVVKYGSDVLAEYLGCSKGTVLKLIDDLNDKMIVKSTKSKNKKGGYKYEHTVLRSFSRWDLFKEVNFNVKVNKKGA